ncbi:MAG: apolipoprotein N-acyltransferase, partial [Primorskyibacter sp.]
MRDRLGQHPRGRLALALALGAVTALGMPPWDLWWLALPALMGGVWVWHMAVTYAVGPGAVGPGRAAAVAGWAYGLGYFGLSLSWIVEPFLVDIGRHGWMAPFALMFLAGGLALFWAAAWAIAWMVGGRGAGWAALPLCWTLAELARGYALTGFSWGTPGYLWSATPVAQWAAVVGSFGLGLLTFAVAVGFVWGALSGHTRACAAVCVVAGALWGGGLWRVPPMPENPQPAPVVRVIQPNAAQHLKWQPDMIPVFFDRSLAATAAVQTPGLPAPSLVVWPETSVPRLLHQAQPAFDA